MICPKCKQDMIAVEYHQIELDHCPRCKGVWFDGEELELFLQSAKIVCPELEPGNIVRLPEVKAAHAPIKCPVCGRVMKEVALGQPAVNIDVCRRQDGLWFDGGELHDILRQTAGKETAEACDGQPVLGFLGEVFRGSE